MNPKSIILALAAAVLSLVKLNENDKSDEAKTQADLDAANAQIVNLKGQLAATELNFSEEDHAVVDSALAAAKAATPAPEATAVPAQPTSEPAAPVGEAAPVADEPATPEPAQA